MGYTRDQLEAMGATPVTQPVQTTGQSPVAPQASTTPKRKYTLAELQQMGAKPAQPPAPEKQDGLLATLIKDPIETLVVKPADRFAEAIGRTGWLGEDIKRGYEAMADEGQSRTFGGIEVEPQKAFGAGGGKQILGEAAKTASYLYSGGKAPQPVSKLLQGKYVQGALQGGKIGGVSGALYGAGEELQNTDSTLGSVGTKALQGGGIGVVGGAILGGGAPLAVKGAGVLAREGLGVSTGVGGGVIREGLSAASQGGKQAEAFRNALRGNVSPEEIVDEARSALGQIITNRTNAYRNQLAKVATNTKVFDDISPVVTKFNKMLEDYGVTFNEKGLPDFTRSPGLGRYEKDLTNISGVLANWGTKAGDNTIVGIDKLKQVLDDFRIGSADSRKFDSFVTALRNETKNIIKNEPNYNKMVSDYENSTGLIKEIQRGLSLGDKAQADTAFRKLTSVLRTNNELRKQLIDEISEISGGTLVPKIAGQQLSETLPRGLMRPLGQVAGGAGIVTGNIIPVLLAALATSPRLVGEILSILGYSAAQIKRLLQIIAPQGLKMPGTSDGAPPKNQPRSKIPPTMTADQKAPTQQSQSGAELSSSMLKTSTPTAKASMSAGKLLSDISTGVSQSRNTVKTTQKSKTGTKNMYSAGGGVAGMEDTDGDGKVDSIDPLKAGLGMAIGSIASRAKMPKKGSDKKLLVVHNLTDKKLRFADRIGGLANPSTAVINPNVNKFDSYGDISLVADKELIRGEKTHLADAYSPRFPSVHTTMDWSDFKNLEKEFEPYYAKIGADAKKISFDDTDMVRYIENNPAVALKFLEQRGIKPSPEGQHHYFSQIDKLGLENEYQSYLDDIYTRHGLKEQMFAGYTNTGRRRYKPVSAEGASKIMSKQKDEGMDYGIGSWRSKVAPVKRTPESVRKEEGRIMESEKFDAVKEQYSNDMWSLQEKLKPYAKVTDSNNFIETDRQLDAISAVVKGERDAMRYFRAKYPDAPEEIVQELYKFRKKLEDMPTEYFETKFKRPVKLNEFRIAVAPEKISPEARRILEKQGVEIVTYKEGEKDKVMKSLLNRPEAFAFGAAGAEDTDGDGVPDDVDPLKAGIGMAIGSIASKKLPPGAFKGFTDLSTKLLSKLEGRTTVSRQFIADMMKSPDVKKAEREIFERVLNDMTNKNLSKTGGNAYAQMIADLKDGVPNTGKKLMDEADKTPISVKDFANKVKTELVPLKVKSSDTVNPKSKDHYASDYMMDEGKFSTGYDHVVLPKELRGDVLSYREDIYESPIRTSAGEVHFNYNTQNYFAHTRLEEMSPSYMPGKGKVERTIELQSDLMQKDGLEREAENVWGLATEKRKGLTIETAAPVRAEEVNKLEPYRNDWAPRIIREDIKDAAKRGVNTKLYPTGETAMKIEGLATDDFWYDTERLARSRAAIARGESNPPTANLKKEDLKIGAKVSDRNSEWIITDVLGDGKFKAMPKDTFEKAVQKGAEQGMSREEVLSRSHYSDITANETFDISGKVDTENPIYKFYESTIGKYLKNKYGAKLVTDNNGVKWWEVDVKKDHARLPVEAFALAPIGISLADRSKEKK